MQRNAWLLAAATWLAVACGGGGGGNPAPVTASSVTQATEARSAAAEAGTAAPPQGAPDSAAGSAASSAASTPAAAPAPAAPAPPPVPAVAAPAPVAPASPATTAAGQLPAIAWPQLAQVIHMGQSLAAGQDGFPLLSGRDTGFGNFRFARGVHTWRAADGPLAAFPAMRPDADFELVPLTSGDPVNHYGETIANGLADQLKTWLAPRDTRLLFSYPGEGNRRLRELDKRHDSSRDPRSQRRGPGGYYATSVDDVLRGHAQAVQRGWRHSVVAITWMQGESEADLKADDWSVPDDVPTAVDRYVRELIALKDDWNGDLRAITGQTERIHVFSYQTAYGLSGQAQLAAADRDREIHVVAPLYAFPNALEAPHPYRAGWGDSNHLTSDGQRWLGAQFAKAMRRQLVEGEPWTPLRPLRAWASADRLTVFVRYAVPRPPLVIDTSFLPGVRNAGFAFTDGAAITDVALADDRTIALKLAAPLAPGVALNYAWDGPSTEILWMPAPIREVRMGAPAANGRETYEVVFPGDLLARFEAVVRAGPFYLSAMGDAGMLNGVIREVKLDAQGNTVLRGEAAELLGGRAFAAGQTAVVRTVSFSGNLRDSDPEVALQSFAFGTRKGQRYPLWNWAVRFGGLVVEDRAP